MTRAQLASLITGFVALGVILDLVRRRHLRVRFAGMWLVVGIGMTVLAVSPGLLDRTAAVLGVIDPPNLLFFVAIIVLLVVVVQLSLELSRVDEKLRILAEEMALLRHEMELTEDPPSTDERDPDQAPR
jgi:hypothetical protein